ncbi:MAG: hypothetical protein N3D12_00640 [Candidatus Methanomethyliaceae archaeon]|nr:hypothetical protein [Candidatus Methanomethyliaceae archaeon]
MVSPSPKKDLSRFVYCSSLLEEKIAKVYENLAKVINDDLFKCLFRYIASDSLKHAEFFRALSKWLNPDIELSYEECAEVWGEKWKVVMEHAEVFQEKGKINHEELSSLIDGLEKLEGMVAEEYLTIMHIRLIQLMAEDRKIDLDYFKKILEWIIEDENRHEQILKTIKSKLIK